MLFGNIDFHNVEALELCGKGYKMSRIPAFLREKMPADVQTQRAYYSTGVELRFVILEDAVTLTLCADAAEEANTAYIYYGSFQAGWACSSKAILPENTAITIPAPDNLPCLRQITAEQGLSFDPAVVRVVLPYGTCFFVGSEGALAPPTPAQLPEKTYLAYGSSITHGSLALCPPCTYPFRIARHLQCDYLNLGFAGSARLEPEMAAYLVAREDWSFASVELGINMLDKFTSEAFEARVKAFLDILAADPRPVFVTSIFGFNAPLQEQAVIFREIVKKYAQDRFVFTDGLALLNRPAFISQDMTHPDFEGINEIVTRWGEIMSRYL